MALLFVVIAGYCTVANSLYIGRLAAYVAIVRGPEIEVSRNASSVGPANDPASLDRGELILSDVPLLAT
jgi:hypothetical protein